MMLLFFENGWVYTHFIHFLKTPNVRIHTVEGEFTPGFYSGVEWVSGRCGGTKLPCIYVGQMNFASDSVVEYKHLILNFIEVVINTESMLRTPEEVPRMPRVN